MNLKTSHITAIVVCSIAVLFIVYFNYDKILQNITVENFNTYPDEQNPANIKMNIIDLYSQLLNRQPTNNELRKHTNDITIGNISIYGLRQTILDSREYNNLSKLQSNSLNPELEKMVSDKQIIDTIANIYNEELDTVIPPKMVLPLRDIYIYLDYNKYALIAMFRSSAYPSFEADCMNTPDLDNNQTMEIFHEYFSRSQLIKSGNVIASVMQCLTPVKTTDCALSKDMYSQVNKCNPDLLSLCSSNISNNKRYTYSDTPDPLSEAERAQLEFNKNLAARQMSEGNFNLDFNTNQAKTEYKVPIQKGPYIILPEMAWAVPQPRAPICTSLGQAPLTQPVMTNSKLLLQGLPINQAAKDTGVGSIMPKFMMQQYVSVNSA